MSIVKELEDKFSKAKEARLSADDRWYMSAAFLFGKQWIGYDADAKKFLNTPVPSWRVRVVANMIFPIIRQLISKVVRQDLNAICVPLSKDESAKSSARVASKIIKATLDKNKIRKMAYDIVLNIFTFGLTYIKVFWDAKEKAFMPLAKDEKVSTLTPEDDRLADELGLPNLSGLIEQEHENLMAELEERMPLPIGAFEGQFEEYEIGDIVIENLRPDFVYLDHLATTVDEARYLFICKLRSADYVKERYGVEVKEKEVVLPTPQQSIDSLLQTGSKGTKTGVLVKEYWERKSSEYPNGRFIVLANEEIVKEGDNPYADIDNELPLVQINYFPPLNNLYSTSIVEQLIPLQKEYNRLRSDVVEHEKVMMRGKWLVPIGCNISKNSITSEPGEKIYYDPRGGAPTAIAGTPPPAEIWQHILSVKNEFNDIAGLHEVSRGRVPSGVRAASGIMFLQEQDDIQLSVINAYFQEGFLEICRRIVQLARKYYKEDRLLKLVGQGNSIEIFEFKQGAIKNDNFDIQVEFGSKTPFSYVARQQFILSLWDRGIIRDENKILKLLEFTVEDDIYKSTEPDEIQARVENYQMQEGQMCIVEDYEDHGTHIRMHNEFRKNINFKKLPREIQELFREHVNIHQQFIMAQMAMMMEQQAGTVKELTEARKQKKGERE